MNATRGIRHKSLTRCDLVHALHASTWPIVAYWRNGARAMDKQPSGIPKWLSVDLTLIAVGIFLAVLGVWLGYADTKPFHILATGLR